MFYSSDIFQEFLRIFAFGLGTQLFVVYPFTGTLDHLLGDRANRTVS
jgi:hypothetical protein